MIISHKHSDILDICKLRKLRITLSALAPEDTILYIRDSTAAPACPVKENNERTPLRSRNPSTPRLSFVPVTIIVASSQRFLLSASLNCNFLSLTNTYEIPSCFIWPVSRILCYSRTAK